MSEENNNIPEELSPEALDAELAAAEAEAAEVEAAAASEASNALRAVARTNRDAEDVLVAIANMLGVPVPEEFRRDEDPLLDAATVAKTMAEENKAEAGLVDAEEEGSEEPAEAGAPGEAGAEGGPGKAPKKKAKKKAAAATGESAAPPMAPDRDRVIVLEPCREVIHHFLSLLRENDLADIQTVSSPDEAVQAAMKSLPCMLMISINGSKDVGPSFKAFTRLEDAMERQGLRVLVTTPIKSKKLAFLFFKRFSVTEYLEEPIPLRTFQFKAIQLLKTVSSFRKEQRHRQQSAGAKTRPPIRGVPDIFLRGRSSVRRNGKLLTIDLEGPDPTTGLWVPHVEGEAEPSCWRWVANEDYLMQKNGELPKDGWVAFGNRPIANEEGKTWNFAAEKLRLQFQMSSRVLAEKIGIDEDGFVFVADDPPDALLRLKTTGKKEEGPAWNNRIGEGATIEAPTWNNRLGEGTTAEAPAWNDRQGEGAANQEPAGEFRNLIKPDDPSTSAPVKPALTVIQGDKAEAGASATVIKADKPAPAPSAKSIPAKMLVRGIDFTNKKEIREAANLNKFLQVQQAKNGQKRVPPPRRADVRISIYRTVLVVIADAFANVDDPNERMETILNAMETAYAPVYAVLTGNPDAEGACKILFRSKSAPRVGTGVMHVGGIAAPVADMGAAPDAPPLGHLFLSAMGTRKSFNEDEKKALQQVAARLSPLLARTREKKKAG